MSRFVSAFGVVALCGGSLAQWSPVVAQSESVSKGAQRATPVTSSSFGVTLPGFQTYLQQHGGLPAMGRPLSNDFQMLGRRVQIFDHLALQQQADGSTQALDLLGDALPILHADGATFPAADPDLVATNPPLESPAYREQALASIDAGTFDAEVPDTWNDLPVLFGAAFRSTVTCSDLPSSPCDQRSLLRAALDVWGLPMSAPTTDPGNPDLTYLRFQRGIMQYSQATGQTQAVPLGALFKRELIGTDLPDDMAGDLLGSRYLAQYSPSLPLGVSRPSELPATSLAAAFSPPTTISAAAQGSVAQLSTTPVLAGIPAFGTPVAPALSPSFQAGTSGPLVGTPTIPFATPGIPIGTPTPAIADASLFATQGSTPVSVVDASAPLVAGASGTAGVPGGVLASVATPTGPQGPDPCVGDEQVLFAPKKPYVGTDVLIAVTSSRHHDVRTVRLTGPVKPGPVNERAGLNGWVWEWTISPPVEGWYEFTFYADGARACATSGFNAIQAFGSTALPSPTATPQPFATQTLVPTQTATATPTTVPAPALASTAPVDPPTGACSGHLLRLNGTNFGSSQNVLNGNVVISGPTGANVATIFSWTNSMILLTVPTGLSAGAYQIAVTTSNGASSLLTYQVGTC